MKRPSIKNELNLSKFAIIGVYISLGITLLPLILPSLFTDTGFGRYVTSIGMVVLFVCSAILLIISDRNRERATKTQIQDRSQRFRLVIDSNDIPGPSTKSTNLVLPGLLHNNDIDTAPSELTLRNQITVIDSLCSS